MNKRMNEPKNFMSDYSFQEFFRGGIAEKLGMMVAEPKFIPLQSDRVENYIKEIRNLKQNCPDLDLVFCIMNEKRTDK